jgi:hypothetical protein
MMTLPAFLFGFLISTLLGAIFHLWKDGGFGRLLLYLILAWVGFWAGHLIANSLGWTFISIGPLHLGMALLVAAFTLYAGNWLSLINQDEPRR